MFINHRYVSGIVLALGLTFWTGCEQQYSIVSLGKTSSATVAKGHVEIGGTQPLIDTLPSPKPVDTPIPSPTLIPAPAPSMGPTSAAPGASPVASNDGSGGTPSGDANGTPSGGTSSSGGITSSVGTGSTGGPDVEEAEGCVLGQDDDDDGECEVDEDDNKAAPVRGRIIINVRAVVLKIKKAGENRERQIYASESQLGQVDLLNLPQGALAKAWINAGDQLKSVTLEAFETGNEVREGDKVLCKLNIPSSQVQLKFDEITVAKDAGYSIQVPVEEAKYHPIQGEDGLCQLRPEAHVLVIKK